MSFLSGPIQNLFQSISQNQAKLWRWALILVSTYFVAKTLSHLTASFFLPLELPEEGDAYSSSSRRVEPRVEISRIIDRNIFNSRAKDSRFTPEAQPELDFQNIRPSNIAADLLGTLDFENSVFSAALVKDRGSNSTSFYRRGDRLQDASVVKVERHRLIIERAGRLEFLEIQAAKLSPKTAAMTTPGAAGGSEDIKQIEDNRFEVTQASLTAALEDPALMSSARAEPNIDANGRINGFRITNIQDNSVFKKLGIQRGDVIKRVNGDELNGIDKVTQLFGALRSEKRISLDIERNGVGVNYIYDIR